MKKFSILFGASFLFALPALAQSQNQSSTYVTPDNSPVQVYVTINNTASGNSQTTNIDNKQNQTNPQNSQTEKTTVQNTQATNTSTNTAPGTGSLYGNYQNSPYQSNLQTEMLRNNVWQSLVPRKRLFDDPAIAKYPNRHTTGSNANKNTADKNQKANQDIKIVAVEKAAMDENELCPDNKKTTENKPEKTAAPTAQPEQSQKEKLCTDYENSFTLSEIQAMEGNPYRTTGEMKYSNQDLPQKKTDQSSSQEQNPFSFYDPMQSEKNTSEISQSSMVPNV